MEKLQKRTIKLKLSITHFNSQLMLTVDVSIVISIIALTISLVSLYLNVLKPFDMKVLHSSPTFCLYKITPSISGTKTGETWWIPSFDIGVSFYNRGTRFGEILDVRMKIEIKSFDESEIIYKSTFYPKWIVDYSKFQKDNHDRVKWIETSVKREWYPIFLKGNSESHIHLILENNRMDEVLVGIMYYCLEVISSKDKKWIECATYEIPVTEDLYKTGSTMTGEDKKIRKYRLE